jgi:hypothetical protein
MQVNTSSPVSAAQTLGPTVRPSGGRADIGTVARHVANPVGESAARSVETIRSTRLSAQYDKPTGRVVTRVIDETNGEVVHQYPDDDALRVLAGIREMVGLVVDESA